MRAEAQRLPAGKPAVLYLRCSSDQQEQSVPSQRAFLQRYAAENGFDLLNEFVDDGISGTEATAREGFQRLIREAQGRPRFRYVLCYDVKRFSRGDVDEVGHYRFLLRERGIEVVYATEGFQDDFTGDVLRPIRQVMARQESVDLSRVTIRGQVSALERGSYVCGVPPWGYDLLYHDSSGEPYQIVRFMESGEREILKPDGTLDRRIPRGENLPRDRHKRVVLVPSLPERVEAVRYIYRMYVHERLGYRAITNRLNMEGIPSPRRGRWGRDAYDGRWGISTVKSILMNQTFAGDTVWARRTQARFHRVAGAEAARREWRDRGASAANPPEDWIVQQNTHEPLIDRRTWEAAQRIRRERDAAGGWRRPLGRGRYSNFLLTDLIECGECHHRFQGYSQKYRQGPRRPTHERPQSYLCGGYITKGRSVCKRRAIEKAPFEEFILGRVHARLMQVLENGGRDLLRRYVEEEMAQALQSPREELGRVEAELDRLKADIKRLLASISPANRDVIDEEVVELKRRRRDLEARREGLLEAVRAELDLDAAVEAALGRLTRFREVLEYGTFPERKEFLRGFVAGITLYPSEMRGELRMHDMVAASFCCRGWSRPKLYRHMRRYGVLRNFGKSNE